AAVMARVCMRARVARPLARGRNRLRVGPSSTYAALMTSTFSSNASPAWSALTRALAIALSTTLRTVSAAACGANRSTLTASVARWPRMLSTTRRAFRGVTRTYRACALASIDSCLTCRMIRDAGFGASAAPCLTVVLVVPAVGAGRGELPQLVADHRLGDEDRHVLAAVVHRKGVSQEVGRDDRPAGPGLDDVLGTGLVGSVHLLEQVVVDERTLLQAARHLVVLLLSALLAGAPAAHDELVARLVRTAGPALDLTPGADRVAT